MRATSLRAEVFEERGEWWDLRWTLFSVSHGKDGFRSPGTKGQFLKRAWRKWSRTGWAPEGCLHILCVGVGEGELLLEEGHWDEVPFPLRGAELTVTESQDSHFTVRMICLRPSIFFP